MASLESGTLVDLALHESIILSDIEGVTLRVNRGTVWITQENDTRDIVLGAGDTWRVERPGRTIIAAQSRAVLWAVGRGMERAARRASQPAGAAALVRRLASALAASGSLVPRRPLPYV